jgi:hypothetical protein
MSLLATHRNQVLGFTLAGAGAVALALVIGARRPAPLPPPSPGPEENISQLVIDDTATWIDAPVESAEPSGPTQPAPGLATAVSPPAAPPPLLQRPNLPARPQEAIEPPATPDHDPAATAESTPAPPDPPTSEELRWHRRPTSQPGVVAQTESLIPQKAPKDTIARATVKPVVRPVRLTKPEALAYAAQTDQRLRQEGKLTPTQRVRLPRRSESRNSHVWTEEDDAPPTPSTTSTTTPPAASPPLPIRRPFGLLIEDAAPRPTPPPVPEAPRVKPLGQIPLRTDVPAGESPLQHTTTPRPLWTRPEGR